MNIKIIFNLPQVLISYLQFRLDLNYFPYLKNQVCNVSQKNLIYQELTNCLCKISLDYRVGRRIINQILHFPFTCQFHFWIQPRNNFEIFLMNSKFTHIF